MRILKEHVDLLESVISDIGDHVLAAQVVELHRRMKWEIDVRAAVSPETFKVEARLHDSDDCNEGWVDAAPWLQTLTNESLSDLLNEEGGGAVAEDLFAYYRDAKPGENRSVWGVRVAQDVWDYVCHNEASFYSEVNDDALIEWVKQNRSNFWVGYAAEHGIT